MQYNITFPPDWYIEIYLEVSVQVNNTNLNFKGFFFPKYIVQGKDGL